MVASITFNPILTSNAAGSFNTSSTGLIQGTAYDDPATRYALAGGILALAETLPMWGGVGISEAVAGAGAEPNTVSYTLGGNIIRATNNSTTGAAASLTGFSVFDQDNAMITTPQSPVPLAASYMGVHFYRLGSRARIAVKCDASLVDLKGAIISSQVSWDFVGQLLVPYTSTTISSLTSYNSGTGLVTLALAGASGLVPGDHFQISAATGTGADLAVVNGEHIAGVGTTGTTLTFSVATGLTISTVTGGTVGTGAIPVKVLDVQIGNCMTVEYDAVTGFATWNRNGNAAVIQI